MSVAVLFPGQGSQYVGMGADLITVSEEARRIFRTAGDVLGYDLAALCREGPADRLDLTEYTQPAILTVSIAAWVVCSEKGVRATVMAGHSLGEYSALVASGSLDFRDAVVLVRNRGRYMQEAVAPGVGAMAAILGLNRDRVVEICRRASEAGVVSAANINSPVQIVIAGEKKAVEAAMALAKESGAKRVIPLPVSVPSHCSLMEPAAKRLAQDLERVPFRDCAVPVVANADAEEVSTGDRAKKALLRQLTAPVLWVDTIEKMVRGGVGDFVEIGPGTVLSGLVKRIAKGTRVFNIEDRESLGLTLGGLAHPR